MLSTAAVKQEQYIADMRKLLKPTEVRLHHCPKWFWNAGRKVYKKHSSWSASWWVCSCLPQDPHWLDHWGSTKLHDGRIAFVSEPYIVNPLPQDVVKLLEEIASRISCLWWVSANSWWYPTSTTRIVFAQKAAGLDQLMENRQWHN